MAGDEGHFRIVRDEAVAGGQALPGIAPAPILPVHLADRDAMLIAVHDHGRIGEPGALREAAIVLENVLSPVVGETQIEAGKGGLAHAADPGGKAMVDLSVRRKSGQGIDPHTALLPKGKGRHDPSVCFGEGGLVHHAPAFSSRSR